MSTLEENRRAQAEERIAAHREKAKNFVQTARITGWVLMVILAIFILAAPQYSRALQLAFHDGYRTDKLYMLSGPAYMMSMSLLGVWILAELDVMERVVLDKPISLRVSRNIRRMGIASSLAVLITLIRVVFWPQLEAIFVVIIFLVLALALFATSHMVASRAEQLTLEALENADHHVRH